MSAALVLSGCVGGPGEKSTDSLVITEETAPVSPARAQAIAEMRAEVAAINERPPAESPAEQTLRLSRRAEPRTMAEVEAIEAELALIAQRRAGASPSEVAALDTRAAELRRLAAAAQAGSQQ
jgi:hypothetical protein